MSCGITTAAIAWVSIARDRRPNGSVILAKYGHNLPESRVMIYCDGEDEQAADYTARTALGAHGEGE
jgi:hypothetical protein